MSTHSCETGKRVGVPQASPIVTVWRAWESEFDAVCVEAQPAARLAISSSAVSLSGRTVFSPNRRGLLFLEKSSNNCPNYRGETRENLDRFGRSRKSLSGLNPDGREGA